MCGFKGKGGMAVFEGLAVTEKFRNSVTAAVTSSRLSHGIILEGSDENTREQCAKIIASAILCTGENKPCGKCLACRKVADDNHPDIHYIRKPEGRAGILIEQIRDLKLQAKSYPNEGRKSVFIICEAQLMNIPSQNALLKIFEEPSDHVCFILTCPSRLSLLETIISRGTAYLLSEQSVTEKSAELSPAKEKAVELMESLCSESELEFIRRTSVFVKNKQLFADTLGEIIPILRDTLILQSGGRELISGCDTTAKKLRTSLTQRQTTQMIEKITELRECVASSGNHNLQITRFSAVLYSTMKG